MDRADVERDGMEKRIVPLAATSWHNPPTTLTQNYRNWILWKILSLTAAGPVRRSFSPAPSGSD
jgi:hypothetical protein